MSNALRNAANAATNTPINQKAKTEQVKNNTEGYVFRTSDQSRLERFLILGTDGGTYYSNEKELTSENVSFLNEMIERDEANVLKTIVDVSVGGRAYKQSPALFALASVIVNGTDKQAVKSQFNQIVRTATHLYEVVDYLNSLGGWGRAKREIVSGWFDKDADRLAYQAVKYRSRKFGKQVWTLRDVMRKSHPQNVDASVADFILGKEGTNDLRVIEGFKLMQNASTTKEVVDILTRFEMLSWETIPTNLLKDAKIWQKLFENGQLRGQALVRNITRIARYGGFNDMKFAAEYATALADEQMIEKTRLHPINFLNASVVFTEGQIDRNGYGYGVSRKPKDWVVNGSIADALTEGFHKSFKHVESAGKRTLVATDVSGSMSWSAAFGLDLSAAQVSAAVAMTVARTEPYSNIVGFTSSIVDLGITAKTSLSDAMRKVQKNNFGSTNVASAIEYATKNAIDVDTFVIITDNETNCGGHPFQSLKKYRKETGIDARLAVLGVSSTGFSVADPSDKGTMDFVGFDSNAPRVLADFSAGRI